VCRGQVRPKLEAVHPSPLVALRHLLVQDSAPGRHPLHVSGRHAPLVSQAVPVRHLAGKHVCNRLDPAMRMPGKPGQVIRRIFIAKIVQQQERIEFARVAKAEGALQLDAGAFNGWFGANNLFYCTKRHNIYLPGPDSPMIFLII
jgi:hypothetical protein